MSGQLSATTHLEVVTTLHRGAPSQPTSIRPYSPFDMINNDVLLNIFNIYRLDIRNEEEDENAQLARWWYKLAHVSRQWRYLILASPARLNIHLLCTYGVPVADMLAHSPPLLPLTVFYNDFDHQMTTEDEEGALLALSHRHRVRRIALWMPASNLGKLIAGINEEFPILERMRIWSQAEGSTGLVISGTVQAPNLRHFSTASLGFPLLTNAVGLVNLELIDIPASAYFPPAYILNRILLMPQLRILKIHFLPPLPNRDVESQLSNDPIATEPLLHLHLLSFRGVNAYLEGLLSGISAPALSILDIQFFNQAVRFNVPRLLQFTETSENLRFSEVELSCEEDSVTLIADPEWGSPLCVEVMCRRLDWQVSCAVEILLPILSAVEKLTLSHVEDNQSSESPNEVDRTEWRELLRPFGNVRTLCVSTVLVGELSRSLCSEGGEKPLEVLPNLLELQCSGGSGVAEAFAPFIIERETVGHPVSLNSSIDNNYTIDDNDSIDGNYTINKNHSTDEIYAINENFAVVENFPVNENYEINKNCPIHGKYAIHAINDDVLFNIFNIYRLDNRDEDEDENARFALWLFKLAHFSRQWRDLIIELPAQWDILLCTYDVPVADMLAHLPSLVPLAVSYNEVDRKMTTEDEKGALLALSHRHCVRRIALWMPASSLGKIFTEINEEFPILECMRIGSQAEGSTGVVISGTVQAPSLRHFSTTSLGFPLLTNAAGLVNLELIDIPTSAYFPPAYILNRILLMPQLRILKIHFHSPLPDRNVESQLWKYPIAPLLHLHLLSFRGVNAYLEDLLSGISAPALSILDIQFFNQAVRFNVPRLLQFTETSENLRFSEVELACEENSVTLIADPDWGSPLCVQILCRRLDWQVSCAVEILGALLPILSAVEKLTLSHVEDNQSSESPNEVDRTEWRELFRPFPNVKTLCVSTVLAGELSRSLCSEGGEMPLEVLPSLLELRCFGGSSVVEAFSPFIIERERAGYPVCLRSERIEPQKRSERIEPQKCRPKNIESPLGFDRSSFIKYMQMTGRAYRRQAMELISACRLFAQTQDQSSESDVKLTRALAAVDEALSSATDAKEQKSKDADMMFQHATNLLCYYEWRSRFRNLNDVEYIKSDKTLFKRMEEARSKDKSFWTTILLKLRKKKPGDNEWSEPTRDVTFFLCSSPTDRYPIVACQVLSEKSDLKEVLWNFSRLPRFDDRRLTLRQNPHFYRDLPASPEEYKSTFQADPIEDFHNVNRVWVLTDKPRRVYLQGTPRSDRAFGNVWLPDRAIIFKDIFGKLEGESHVEATVNATAKIWYRRERPLSRLMVSVVNHSAARNIPLWKLAIHQMMEFQNIDILISTRSQPPEGGWTLYRPSPSSPSSSRSRLPQQSSISPQHSLMAQPTHGPKQDHAERGKKKALCNCVTQNALSSWSGGVLQNTTDM